MDGYKMILPVVVFVFLFKPLECYPQSLKLPDFEASTPEEVNSLELEEPYRRSVDSNDIEDTVTQVEQIIKTNPALPRLTRGEILDLLENITQVDEQKARLLGKNRTSKAIMVVMPFTPSNDNNMEDLYTKAPVTHMVGEPFRGKDEPKQVKHSRRRPPVQYNETDNELVKKPSLDDKKNYSTSKPETSTTRISLRRRTTTTTTTQAPPTTYHPRSRRPTRRRTTQHPNHRYPGETLPIGGITIVESPQLIPHLQFGDLDIQENVRHEVVVSTPKPHQSENVVIPDNLKAVMTDLNLDNIDAAQLEEQSQMKSLLASVGVLPEATTTTTTTTSAPNAENIVESLSPDMRDLLMSFGLLPTKKPAPTPPADKYNPEKAEVKPESYSGFKPLPDDGPSRDDMNALLASFGLGRNARKEKSLVVKTEKNSLNVDMVPDAYKDIIADLGIAESNRNKKSVLKQHVFNPDTQYATEEELKKLEQLIGMIKQLEKMNGTATAEDLKKLDLETLKALLGSLNNDSDSNVRTLELKESDSPNPTSFDVGVTKNEVKRQESTTESSTSTSSVETGTPSLKDLEASFGGQTEATTEPPPPETTPSRNGFYYLVDWNTFLDIDDTKGRRVNLRFQPKVGDPKRFLSV